ncbi:small ribosomal subunit protein mL103 (rPPR7) [Aristolochia californica]|uniref:small ribosomal subunit protein mL103 (rPPR7) n=1 Tax=Aristolochia californica TaxID=171875 RepID=UPI0035E0698E
MGFFSYSSVHRHLLPYFRRFSTSPNASVAALKSKLRAEHDPDKALAIFSSVTDSLPTVSSRFALDLTVKRLAKSRRFSDIENLIESQKKSPKITQEAYLSSLIRAYGNAGMVDNAVKTFEQMDEMGAPRSVVSFNALLSACNRSRRFEKVPKLFNELSEKYRITPNEISYGILIKSLCDSSSPESACSVLEEMREKKVEVTPYTYTSLLDAFYEKGKVQEAEKIWEEMGKKGCSRDATAYNVKVKYASGGKPEAVLKLMDEMIEAGLKPDTISYNYLMTSYSKNHQMEEAVKVYQGLPLHGCSANAATFRVLLFFLCRHKDYDKGLEVFETSVKVDRIPDFGTLKLLVEGLAMNSRSEEAKNVIRVVKKKFPESFLKAWKKLEAKLGLNEDKDAASIAT